MKGRWPLLGDTPNSNNLHLHGPSRGARKVSHSGMKGKSYLATHFLIIYLFPARRTAAHWPKNFGDGSRTP